MSPTSFEIAIPSYKRNVTLCKKTLPFLLNNGFPRDMITVFVANEEEAALYRRTVPTDIVIVIGRLGINHQRHFIESYYPPETKLLCCDDDISRIKKLGQPMPLLEAVRRMFDICAQEQCYLWGIHPNDNGLSLKDEAVVGLRFIIGCFYGIIIKEPLPLSPSPFCEDFWRTIEAFKRDGKVIRFNCMGPTTRYVAEAGGLQEFREPALQDAAFVELCRTYPQYVTLRKRENKYTDARLNLITEKRIQSPLQELSP
jgi:hypothetical protein